MGTEWDGTKYSAKIDDQKTFEKNNPTTALNVLYIKEMEIFPAYISKINSNCEKQIIILINPNKEKDGWYYLAVKRLSALLRGITSKHQGDFYCLNCLHSFATFCCKINFNEKLCKKKDLCGIVMPSKK